MNNPKLNTLLDFAQFLRQNGDKLFEKDSKLCLRTDQLVILQDYLEQITNDSKTKRNNVFNTKEFLTLYKTNQLHIIQDFLFKITNLKIIAENPNQINLLKLNIFGSLTYLEIKNCPVININDLQTLRNQLEVLICVKSLNKVQDILHLCGADQSMPLAWPKLHTLNLSHNQLNCLDNSLRLTSSIEILDLSHNNLKDCANFIHNLKLLKKVNLSFNKLEKLPSLSISIDSLIEYLDVSYNSIEKIDTERIESLVKLNYLNLNSNLIQDLQEVNHLKQLNNINFISLEQNPVKNDLYCDLILTEIKSHKPRLNRVITIKKASPKLINDPTEQLVPKSTQKIEQKRKLKANNILMEQDERSEDDYLIINTKSLDLSKASLKNKLSMSYSEYESNNLQIEIEKMKQMRQNYGTDWLLSTPNLIAAKPSLIQEPQIEVYKSETNLNLLDQKLLENVIDPFVVYKFSSVEDNSLQDCEAKKTCVLLSLNDIYLIEKDETNTDLLDLEELAHLEQIKFDHIEIKFNFKTHKTKTTIYTFENNDELNIFIEHLRKILFKQTNLFKCELYYCVWCVQFIRKSKFNINEDTNETSYDNLTCTVCNRYLIKEKLIQEIESTPHSKQQQILNPNAETSPSNLTLKEVLKTFKTNEPSDELIEPEIIEETLSNTSINNITLASIVSEEENNLDEKINTLLSNNKVTKSKLDEISNECKRINNNLKLYLIINHLNQDDKNDAENEDEEQPISYFKLKYLFHNNQSTATTKPIENCLCVFTNRNIVLFRIINLDLFSENNEFDKCLKREFVIKITKIETIEVSLGNNYLLIETTTNDENLNESFKFFTMDIYQTSTFRNILLKIMNESKQPMILKHTRTNSQLTKQNLLKLLNKNEISSNETDLEINLFTFIDELKLNDEAITASKFSIHEIFLHSNESILILEENLNYFQNQKTEQQFTLSELSKISDIVQLRLFKEEETKLEISFVDESKNSKQITWLLNFNKQPHMLSQLIALLKQTWEKIYFIELPINY